MTSTTPVDVAAVIVTYNSTAHIGALLDSLPAAMGPLSYSTIVVDNGSVDGTLAMLCERADCTTVASVNDGYAAGMNRAVRASPDSRAILILNPDAELDADSVPRMLAALDAPGVGIVAPRVREADGSLSPTLRRGPSMGRVGGLSFTGMAVFAERIENPREYLTPHAVDWAVGAILLVDRACFEAVGGLDESFFLYSEETDFSLRARDGGWATFYTPDAGAMHVGGGSGENATTYAMQQINRIRLYRRRTGTAAAAVYYSLSVLNELRRAALGSARSWYALKALLRPSQRPPQLKANDSILPH